MDLRTLVDETLRQIIDGTREAQAYAREKNAAVNPGSFKPNAAIEKLIRLRSSGSLVDLVEFEVTLARTDESSTKGGLGVILPIVSAGASGATSGSESSGTRVKFKVPIALPWMKGHVESDS